MVGEPVGRPNVASFLSRPRLAFVSVHVTTPHAVIRARLSACTDCEAGYTRNAVARCGYDSVTADGIRDTASRIPAPPVTWRSRFEMAQLRRGTCWMRKSCG